MANKYQISKVEQLGIIRQVLGHDIDMRLVSDSDKPNVFLVPILGRTSVIKFTDYDLSFDINLPDCENTIPIKQQIIEEKQRALSGSARELRRAMRAYKRDKFGVEYKKDLQRYCEIKDRLFKTMHKNNKGIASLQKNIQYYQEQNNIIMPILSDIDNIEKYAQEVEWE